MSPCAMNFWVTLFVCVCTQILVIMKAPVINIREKEI